MAPGFGYTWTYHSDLYVFSGKGVKGEMLGNLYRIEKSEVTCVDCGSLNVKFN